MNTPPPESLPSDLVPLWESAAAAKKDNDEWRGNEADDAMCDMLHPDVVMSLLSTIAAQRAEVERLKEVWFPADQTIGCEICGWIDWQGVEPAETHSDDCPVGFLQNRAERAEQRIAALEGELSRSCVNPDCGMGVGDKPTCGKCVWCEKAKLEAERDAARAERDEAVKVEREACAKLCDKWAIVSGITIAAAIRSRGETQGGTT